LYPTHVLKEVAALANVEAGEGKGTTGGVDIPQGEGTIGLQLQQ